VIEAFICVEKGLYNAPKKASALVLNTAGASVLAGAVGKTVIVGMVILIQTFN
tara:strand:- start:75 stop:233 length:159 start_codon:yes stop_codon:yes gene_type:complete